MKSNSWTSLCIINTPNAQTCCFDLRCYCNCTTTAMHRFMHACINRWRLSTLPGKTSPAMLVCVCGCADNLQITGSVAFPGHVSYTHGTCSLSEVSAPVCQKNVPFAHLLKLSVPAHMHASCEDILHQLCNIMVRFNPSS